MENNPEKKDLEHSFLRAFKWGSGVGIGCIVSVILPWFLIFAFFGAVGAVTSLSVPGMYNDYPLNEKTIKWGGQDRIAVIKIKGTIVESKSSASFSTDKTAAPDILNQIDKAQNDPSVSAIVLEIDSPGGEVGPSVKIFDRLLELDKSEKPIVSFVSNMAASGGYYVAMPSDAIIAHRAAWVGSIGVILEAANLERLYDKIGYEKIVIKSGELKDLGSESRAMTPGERVILEGLVIDAYDQFLDDFSNSRGIEKKEARKIADGRIFTANEAKNKNLIDEIGGTGDSYRKAAELAGVKNPTIFTYETPFGFSELFTSAGLKIQNLLGIKGSENSLNLKYILQ